MCYKLQTDYEIVVNMLGWVGVGILMIRKSFDVLQVQIHVENSLPKWKSHKIAILAAQSREHGRVPEVHARVQFFCPFFQLCGTRPCANGTRPCTLPRLRKTYFTCF